jgi:hypothetical protein
MKRKHMELLPLLSPTPPLSLLKVLASQPLHSLPGDSNRPNLCILRMVFLVIIIQ